MIIKLECTRGCLIFSPFLKFKIPGILSNGVFDKNSIPKI